MSDPMESWLDTQRWLRETDEGRATDLRRRHEEAERRAEEWRKDMERIRRNTSRLKGEGKL